MTKKLLLWAPVALLCACEPLDLGGGAGVGGRLAFVRDGALVTSQDSGDGELIITDPGTSDAPALSPNGQTVAFAYSAAKDENARGLFRVASFGGTPEAIIEPSPGTSFGEPSWSPDGAAIAFTATTGGDTEILLVPSSGGSAQSISGSHRDLHFPVFLDSSTLVVSKGSGLELHKLEIASGQLTSLGVSSPSRAAVSPSGTKLAYAKNSGMNRIFVLDLATNTETALATTGYGDANPAFAPGGAYVAFDAKGPLESQPKIYAAPSDGTGTTVLLQTGASAAWSF